MTTRRCQSTKNLVCRHTYSFTSYSEKRESTEALRVLWQRESAAPSKTEFAQNYLRTTPFRCTQAKIITRTCTAGTSNQASHPFCFPRRLTSGGTAPSRWCLPRRQQQSSS